MRLAGDWMNRSQSHDSTDEMFPAVQRCAHTLLTVEGPPRTQDLTFQPLPDPSPLPDPNPSTTLVPVRLPVEGEILKLSLMGQKDIRGMGRQWWPRLNCEGQVRGGRWRLLRYGIVVGVQDGLK